MKKGFTLIEMLGVIVILSLLILVTYTGVNIMNKKSKEREFEDYKKTVYMASQTYITTNNIEVEGEVYISISQLLNQSLLDDVVENPKTESKEYNARIKVIKDQAGILVFEYIGE